MWIGVSAGGCAPPGAYHQMIQSSDPIKRAQGCKLAGESRDKTAVPLLVDRLEDRDLAVRTMAQIALRQITGRDDLAYSQTASEAVKREKIRQWRALAREYAQKHPPPEKETP
jgi:hypothetical protein